MLATHEWRFGAGRRGLRSTVETSHLIRYHFSFFYVSMKEHFIPKRPVSYAEYHSAFCQVREELQVNCSRLTRKLLFKFPRLAKRVLDIRSYLIIRSPPLLFCFHLFLFPLPLEPGNPQNHLEKIKSHLPVVSFCELRKIRCSSLCHAPT
jgi:hypothetical protein